jgi:CrcB protein
MQRLIYIGLAGGSGTLLRYWISEWAAARFGKVFPVGTLLVNLAGCLLAGFLFQLFTERFAINQTLSVVVLIGLLGGFTTFSSFGLQTFNLLREGEIGFALLNIAVSNIAGLMLVWVGYSIARIF